MIDRTELGFQKKKLWDSLFFDTKTYALPQIIPQQSQ